MSPFHSLSPWIQQLPQNENSTLLGRDWPVKSPCSIQSQHGATMNEGNLFYRIETKSISSHTTDNIVNRNQKACVCCSPERSGDARIRFPGVVVLLRDENFSFSRLRFLRKSQEHQKYFGDDTDTTIQEHFKFKSLVLCEKYQQHQQ